MGLFFRKSVSFGPLRLTASKQGLSTSFGIKGARVTAGPRGTYVTVSSHGVYYRQRVGIPTPTPPSSRAVQQTTVPQVVTDEALAVDSVFHVPVNELVASNQSELVAKLNQNVAAFNPAWILGILTFLALFMVSTAPIPAWLLVAAGATLTILVSRRFKLAHTHEIHYSLDPQAEQRFVATQQAISALGSCSRVWVLNTSTATPDFKRNAGAQALVTRKGAAVGTLGTKGFKSSLPVPSIQANSAVFHFLPDQILLFTHGRYASMQYGQLAVDVNATRFIETESVPSDSLRVGTTWRFVNKKGGPDKRFNNNRQIPVLQYGEVALKVPPSLQVILQTSNLEKAQAFTSQLRTLTSGS
jgi:hypothetical protein